MVSSRATVAIAALLCLTCAAAAAQSPALGLGHPASPEAVKAIDIDVLPDGRGLPPGHGTAAAGKPLYIAHCGACHGATGTEGPNDLLAGGRGTLTSARPIKTVGSFWPYATTLWDYINRAMPYEQPHSLAADDVYSITAFVLFLNGIVGERDVVSETTLPLVKMPNQNGFVPDNRANENLPRR